MASIYTSNYDIFFATRDDAMDVLEAARDTALNLGSVTLADIRRFTGLKCTAMDWQTWWTYESLRHTGVAKLSKGYGIMLPPPSSQHSKITRCEYQPSYRYSKEPALSPTPKSITKPTPKPLTVTVDYAGIDEDDFNEVLAKVFQYAQTITDREVEINIC